MDWRALNASDLSDFHSFALVCFSVDFWWARFVNLLWSVYSCLSWKWKRILIHFSHKSSTSPLLVAHHKWFLIDLTHSESILQDAFWLAFISFFFMFLTKCHVSNWWFMSGSFSLIYLCLWVWRSAVICVEVIFSPSNICNILINSFFSI